MTNIDQREIAETAFRRNPKREEINEVLKAGTRATRGSSQEPVSFEGVAFGAGRK